MASGHSADSAGNRASVEKEAEPRASAKNESQQLLDEVLQATLELSSADEPLGPDELRKLAAVARKRAGEGLTVETVAELVEAVLRLRYRRMVESSALWDRMTRHIAVTLFEDPRSQERIQAFWKRLCEVAP
ncbi:MAG: hypothetical protein AB7O38_01605 [Pirellulaceae bacterium]